MPFWQRYCLVSHRHALTRLSASLGIVFVLAVIANVAGVEIALLETLRDLNVPGVERFVATEAFSVGRKIGGRTLGSVGINFAEHFQDVVEEHVPTATLTVSGLRYTTGDASLIKVLGGDGKASIRFLAHVHRIMALTEDGGGHTDWRSNFAYLRSPRDQRLWAVHWSINRAGEWTIGAVYVPHPHLDWPVGSRLFSVPTSKPGPETAQGTPPAAE